MKYYIFGSTRSDSEGLEFDIRFITTNKKEAVEYRKVFRKLESDEVYLYQEYEYNISFKKSLRDLKKLQKELEEIWK